jgi:hypothetical protein
MDSEKPNLLQIVLSKNQTIETVRKNLIEGHKLLQENGDKRMVVEVNIRGFEGDGRHPACIKDAKRCFAMAFEQGLAGLIVETGTQNNLICEIYSMAYLKGKVKIMGGKRVIKFEKAGEAEFNAKVLKSCDAYVSLLKDVEEK